MISHIVLNVFRKKRRVSRIYTSREEEAKSTPLSGSKNCEKKGAVYRTDEE